MLSKLLFLGALLSRLGFSPSRWLCLFARGTRQPRPPASTISVSSTLSNCNGRLESNKTTNVVVTWEIFIRICQTRCESRTGQLVCPQGGLYILGRLDESPKCSQVARPHLAPIAARAFKVAIPEWLAKYVNRANPISSPLARGFSVFYG